MGQPLFHLELAMLDRALSLPDPALVFRWDCISVTFGSAAALVIPENFYDYVHGVSLPIPHIETNPAFRQATHTYYPGFSDVNSTTLTLYEDHSYTMHSLMQTWRAIVVDADGNYGLPVDYKCEFKFRLLGLAEGENTATVKVPLVARVIGMFPTTQAPTDLNYQSSDRVIISQEFSVDDVKLERT